MDRKILLILIYVLSFSITNAQIIYNMPVIVDPEAQQILDEGDACLDIPEKDCKAIFLKAIDYGERHKVRYMDYLYYKLGHSYDRRFKFDSAQYYNKIAYKLTDKNNPNAAYPSIINSMGANYFRLGAYDKAAEFMLLTVSVYETQKNPKALVYAYNNLATLMGINENYEEAIAYYKKGYNLLEEIKDTTIIANLASNLAIYTKKADDFTEARKWALRAIDLGKKYNRPDAYSYGHYIMGTTEEDLEQSLAYLKTTVQSAHESNNKNVLADALDIYAFKLSEQGSHDAAIQSIEKAIALHEEAGYNTGLLAAYSNAGTIYYNAGQYKTSSEYFKKFNDLYEETLSEDNKKRVIEMKTKYESERKEKQIAQQELEILKQQSTLFYSLSGAALLLSLLSAGYLYHRKAHRLKLKEVRQAKEIGILNSFILGEERERNRISRDLHDSIAAQLGAAKMRLESISHLEEDKRMDQLEKTARLIGNIHGDVRRIAHNLLPITLEREGLISALHAFVSDINQLELLEITMDNHLPYELDLPQRNELVLYRIIQELINNIIQHAQATKATITLTATRDQIEIVVTDNGIGFTNTIENQGLYSIRQRSTTIGGTFDIQSQERQGTVATLIIKTTTIPA